MRVHVGNLLLVVLEIGSLPSVPPGRQAHWALRSVLAYFWAWCDGRLAQNSCAGGDIVPELLL